MKTNILLSIITLSFTFLFISGCNLSDDLYIDPSTPSKGTPQTMLASVEVNTFLNSEGGFARQASILCEQFAGSGGQYLDLQNYILVEGEYDNLWEGLYTGTMYNAKLIIDTYGESHPYYSGIAKILLAMNLGIATDFWGDVPYSEAFKATSGNFQPKFDSQESVLNSIQTLLSEGIAELSLPEDDNLELPGNDDIIFKGDINSWIRAAWILKAKYANRLSLKNSTGSATDVKTYLNNAFAIDNAKFLNMEAQHDGGNTSNQWGAFQNQRAGYMVANKVFVDALKNNNDPRLEYYFSKTSTGEIIGADINLQVIPTSASILNDEDDGYFNVARNYPLVTMYEANFLLAEAQSRLNEDASEALNHAIKLSISYVTAGQNDGSTLATYTQTTATKTAILTEKWKAMLGQAEAYHDFRRTGIPQLTPRPESAGAVLSYIPQRLPMAQQERLGNPDNVKVYELNVPVWWATK